MDMTRSRQPRSKEDRLLEIASLLRIGDRVRVSDLARRYAVSEVTIRSDLETLEQRKVITRVRGGAIRVPTGTTAATDSLHSEFARSLELGVKAKEAVARAAAEYVEDGDAIALDSSVLAFYLARELVSTRAGLVVVTNGLRTAYHLLLKESFQVLVPGGRLSRMSEAISGDMATLLGNQRLRTGFFSGASISPAVGTMEMDPAEAQAKRALAELCDQVVLMVDSTTADAFGMHPAVPLSGTTTAVSDAALSPRTAAELRNAGVRLELVPSDPD